MAKTTQEIHEMIPALSPPSPPSRQRARWAFAKGAIEAVAITAGFALAGLAWAKVGSVAPGTASSHYPSVVAIEDRAEPSVWLVDGYNVLHAAVLRGRDRANWWTEPRRRALLDRIGAFEGGEAEIWVVFDGSEEPAESTDPASGARCVFAPSADDWLVDRVRSAEDPGSLAVVTADRQVAGRASHRGAQVVSPRAFLARCG